MRKSLSIQGMWAYQAQEEHAKGNVFIGAAVHLVREPDNPHDKNAVEIRLLKNGSKLGYIPRMQSLWLSKILADGGKYSATICHIGQRTYRGKKQIHANVEIDVDDSPRLEAQAGSQDFRRACESELGKSGIYSIINLQNRKMYIGSSRNIGMRWKEHLRNLQNNCHHSQKLQKDWNQYGEEEFEFRVEEHTNDCGVLEKLEEDYIESCGSCNEGYNCIPTYKKEWNEHSQGKCDILGDLYSSYELPVKAENMNNNPTAAGSSTDTTSESAEHKRAEILPNSPIAITWGIFVLGSLVSLWLGQPLGIILSAVVGILIYMRN